MSAPAPRAGAPGTARPDPPTPSRDALLTRTGTSTGSPVSITALDPQTGRQLWVRGLGRFTYGGAATTSNVVVFERDGYDGSIRTRVGHGGSSTRPRASPA